MSVNLQTADSAVFDPQTFCMPSASIGTYRHVLPSPLEHFYGRLQIDSHISGPFNKGIHFTLFETLYDKANYPAGVITDTVALYAGVQSMSKYSQEVDTITVTPNQGVGLADISPGDTFNPYEEKLLEVTLDKEGVASINATITITLVGDPNTYFFTIVGFRFQLPFMLQATWEDGLTITRRFLTSIFNSYGTGETRKILRKNPVRSMQADLTFLSDTSSVQAWQFVRSRAKGPNVIPFYPDEDSMPQANDSHKLYCDTSYRRYSAGGVVIAIKYDENHSVEYYDALRILAVDPDGVRTETEVVHGYAKGDSISPAIVCYPSFGSDSKSNIVRSRGTISLDAEEMYDQTALALENSTYTPAVVNGLPVFNFRINEADSMEISISYQGDRSESGRGSQWYQQGDEVYQNFEVLCVAFNREEYWELVGFLNYIKGRGRPFWIKNYSEFINPFAEGVGYIEVADLDLPDWEDIKYIWAEAADGSYDIVDVTGVSEVTGGFRITFDTPSITPATYYQALKSRLDSDEIQETWFTNHVVEITFPVRELQGA